MLKPILLASNALPLGGKPEWSWCLPLFALVWLLCLLRLLLKLPELLGSVALGESPWPFRGRLLLEPPPAL